MENIAPAGSDAEYNVTGGTTSKGIYKGSNNILPDGYMLNGKISATMASNNLTVALKTKSGGDPSATDPVSVWINGTYRRVTAALSVTKNAGTNWFNAGATVLATKEIDYFVYLIWNTTPATDIMDIGFSRIPFGRVYSDFSATTTNEKYLAFANASTPTSTDDCVVIGRFAATLSAGAAYTWLVPTFTNVNLIQTPIYETRWLTWVPQHSRTGGAYTNLPTVNLANYRIRNQELDWKEQHTQHATPGSSGIQTLTTPFAASVAAGGNGLNSTALTSFIVSLEPATSLVYLLRYDATQEATASNVYRVFGHYIL